MSLRSLINLRIILSVLLIVVFSGLVAVWQVRQSVESEVKSSVNLALQMIEFSISQLSNSGQNSDKWIHNITTMQPVRHLQISIKDHDNKNALLTPLTEIIPRNEIPPNWFIQAVMTESLTSSYDIYMSDGSLQTLIITANPMDEIAEAWGESKAYFWSIVLMIGFIFFTINLAFNSMLQTVKSILSGLHRLEKGQYGYQLPHFKISEFDAIAHEINEMSLALKSAQESNQALARHTMQIQESERQNLSRELHDEMGQSLTAIKAMAVTCQQPSTDVNTVARSIIDICNHLSVVVRSMMRALHPLSLTELGLGATLSDLVREWQRRVPELNFDLDYDPSLEQLSHDVTIHVYRIVQECLTNVVRHANATEVTILLTKRANTVWITVADNGCGAILTDPGFGLLGMRERAESLGGKLKFESAQQGGESVVAQLPYFEEKLSEQ